MKKCDTLVFGLCNFFSWNHAQSCLEADVLCKSFMAQKVDWKANVTLHVAFEATHDRYTALLKPGYHRCPVEAKAKTTTLVIWWT